MKEEELGSGIKKLIQDTVKSELVKQRKKQEALFKSNIQKTVSEFDVRIEKLESRFVKESDVIKELLKKKELSEDATWLKFTEEVLIEAKKEIEETKVEKKKKNPALIKKLIKKINKALDYLASD